MDDLSVASGTTVRNHALNMVEQSGNYERFACYDRETDIAWVPTAPLTGIRGERTDWGVLARDVATGAIVSIEIWAASERLPKELLDALPEPARLDLG